MSFHQLAVDRADPNGHGLTSIGAFRLDDDGCWDLITLQTLSEGAQRGLVADMQRDGVGSVWEVPGR